MENETNDLTTLKPEYLTLPDTPDVKKNDLNYLMEYVCFYQRRYYMACRIPAPLWHHGRHSRNTSTSSSLPRTRYDKIRKETHLRQSQPSLPPNNPSNNQTPDEPTLPTTDSPPQPIEITQQSVPLLLSHREPEPTVIYELTKNPELLNKIPTKLEKETRM